MGVGTSELGSVLSFGSVVYGFATGWTSYAADYTVYQPSNQSRTKVFFAVWIGLIIPLLFTEMLGIAIMTATTLNDGTNKYADGYAASGTGGLLGAVLFGPLGGFGKFCLIILSLSIIANNCPNIYSVGLTIQVLGGRWTQRVPRFVWTAVGTAVYIAIAIPGYTHFESVLENFMNFIGKYIFLSFATAYLTSTQGTGWLSMKASPSATTSSTSEPWPRTMRPSTISPRDFLLVSQQYLRSAVVSPAWSLA